MLVNNYYLIEEDEITTWYNVSAIYDEYVKAMNMQNNALEPTEINELYMKQHQEFKTTSCTVINGFVIELQAIFENMRSKVLPEFLS